MSTAPAIAVRRLAKSFGEVRAVRGVDFEVARGEVFGFLGPNGAGKTTTINMLCTLMKPTSGEARVAGHVPHAPLQLQPRGHFCLAAVVLGPRDGR